MARISFIELPVGDAGTAAAFYAAAFGWQLAAYGPTYACTTTGDVDIGLQADAAEAPSAPLPAIEVDDLESALERVLAAGAMLTKPTFAFPGGRRFHFRDPGGNEVAVFRNE